MTYLEKLVSKKEMDTELPGYAWDLLPYDKVPFDLYKSPMWHAEYDQTQRSPYAALQTSLGCQFHCNFCMRSWIINFPRYDNYLDKINYIKDAVRMKWPCPGCIQKTLVLVKETKHE